MMNRRDFLALSGTAGAAALTMNSQAASGGVREFYELRQYTVETEAQRKGLDDFLKNAAIPAANRLGVKPIGVFYPEKDLGPVWVLTPHKSMESYAAYKRVESWLLLSFAGMPQMEAPVKNPGRVFQLRTYESPSEKTGLKKIEMFNDAGEIRIFREVGLNPVFFGQTLAGGQMPNLTYMLAFESMEAQQAAWKKFLAHPDWLRLKGMAEYADKAILCGITNRQLVAAPYSQV